MRDPAMWGFFSVVITTLGAILVAQISNRRKTTDVSDQITALSESVDDMKTRLNDHIKWHLEGTAHVYLHRRPADRH